LRTVTRCRFDGMGYKRLEKEIFDPLAALAGLVLSA
jgi:predicted secreted protein